VKVVLSHKIALDPTRKQAESLCQAVGCARFAFNWALSEWKSQYEIGGKPREQELRRYLNSIKHDAFPWMADVPKSVVQQAVKNAGDAFERFFNKQSKYPRFKRKGRHDSARLDNGPGTFTCEGRRIKLPKLGWMKTREELRFVGKPLSAVVSREAGRWYVSVAVEVEHAVPEREPSPVVGIDFGVTTAMTLSTGEKLEGPKPLKAAMRKLRTLSRHLSRKKKGSRNFRKCADKLARMHARIKHLRQDWLHKTTTDITRRFGLIGLETLNVKGMVKNRHLSLAISDIGIAGAKRQLKYKSHLTGCVVHESDQWFPSSKICHHCGAIKDKLPLSVRTWTCDCGKVHDRDVNAAINLRNDAVSCTATSTCGGAGSGRGRKTTVKPASMKQEPSVCQVRA